MLAFCDDWPMRPGGVRLALDVAAVRADSAGVGVFAARLAGALGERAAENLALIGVRDDARLLDGIDPGIPRLPLRGPTLRRGRAPNYHAWLQLHADADARRAGASVVHYTNAEAPLRTRLPYVVTVHDLSLIRLPHLHPTARLMSAPLILGTILRAPAIVVPSDWVRRELVEGLRVAARRVVVIEHAPSDSIPPPPAADYVTTRFRVAPGGYLLCVGTIEPRKNIERLVAAFERLADDDAELHLVLAGQPGWRRGPIERRIYASRWRDRIVVTGYVSADDAAALIDGAAVVCYVSIYEGYGLPVIEAMAHGKPVVTSDRTSMPQAAGGAAVLVNPFDVEDIVRGIRDARRRSDELGALGRLRAARRTWADVAAEHWSVYEWVARRGR